MPPSISGSIATRFSWTYNRAAGAMLTTTATTVFSLLLNVTAPFPMFKTFGIFNAFTVICNYILILTWCVAIRTNPSPGPSSSSSSNPNPNPIPIPNPNQVCRHHRLPLAAVR